MLGQCNGFGRGLSFRYHPPPQSAHRVLGGTRVWTPQPWAGGRNSADPPKIDPDLDANQAAAIERRKAQ